MHSNFFTNYVPRQKCSKQKIYLNLQIFEQCLGCAGFSVGEFTSLIFAKSITLEEGEPEPPLKAGPMPLNKY